MSVDRRGVEVILSWPCGGMESGSEGEGEALERFEGGARQLASARRQISDSPRLSVLGI